MFADVRHHLLRAVAVVLGVALLVVAPDAHPVSAHTDLDFTVPTADEVVGAPVGEITVAFTDPVTLVGNGFEVLDPQENILEPEPITDDARLYLLRFDPPLAGGAVGVRYTVRAEDGHEISGAFSFTVDAPVPATAPTAVPSTTLVTTPAPQSTADDEDAATTAAPEPTATEPTEGVPDDTGSTRPSTTGSSTTSPPATSTAVSEPADADDGGSNTGVVIAFVAAVVIVAGGIALVRFRTAA